MAELDALIENISKSPGMFFLGKSFNEFVAFVNGFNLARDSGPLMGFKEWLVVKADKGNNLSWDALAMLYLGITPDVLKKEQDHHAIKDLAQLITAFFTDREKRGLQKFYAEHQKWVERQAWK